jgi:hypothetical protein
VKVANLFPLLGAFYFFLDARGSKKPFAEISETLLAVLCWFPVLYTGNMEKASFA